MMGIDYDTPHRHLDGAGVRQSYSAATARRPARRMEDTVPHEKKSFAAKVAIIERAAPGWYVKLLKDFARQPYSGGCTKKAVLAAVQQKYEMVQNSTVSARQG